MKKTKSRTNKCVEKFFSTPVTVPIDTLDRILRKEKDLATKKELHRISKFIFMLYHLY